MRRKRQYPGVSLPRSRKGPSKRVSRYPKLNKVATVAIDAIHVRAPAAWKGKIDSGKLRQLFESWSVSRGVLPDDPGAGPYEFSVKLDRAKLNNAAQIAGCSGAALLRRLAVTLPSIYGEHKAAQVSKLYAAVFKDKPERLPARKPALVSSVPVRARSPEPVRKARPGRGPVTAQKPKGRRKVSTVVGTMSGAMRSLVEVKRAMKNGEEVSGEEVARWVAIS